MPVTGKLAALKWALFEGGTRFDAFLTAASAQVCRYASAAALLCCQSATVGTLNDAALLCCASGTERQPSALQLSGAFFGLATSQVGQVILTLPHSLAQTNIIGGTILQLTFATWAMYTLYLLGERIRFVVQ